MPTPQQAHIPNSIMAILEASGKQEPEAKEAPAGPLEEVRPGPITPTSALGSLSHGDGPLRLCSLHVPSRHLFPNSTRFLRRMIWSPRPHRPGPRRTSWACGWPRRRP